MFLLPFKTEEAQMRSLLLGVRGRGKGGGRWFHGVSAGWGALHRLGLLPVLAQDALWVH